MKLIVHGQQAFGKAVLEALLDRGEDVCAVYCAPDKGTRIDPLKAFAEEKGLPVFQPTSYKDPAVVEQMRSHEADLCVMAYVTLLVPEPALNAPRLGSIQYHPSLLPLHKGPSSINWPIIFGEKKTGLSIFWPDEGLDTGPILIQKEVEIGPDDTLGSLYFNHLFPMGVAAMCEGVDLVRDGNAPRLVQDPEGGTYEGWCRPEDVQIDWSQPVDTVYNMIRGANPQPGAWTTVAGKKLTIFDSSKGGRVDGDPGTVVAMDERGMTVAANGGSILIQRVRTEDGAKLAAAEIVEQSGISVSTVLGAD
jgi:methionyl-tRNA formyltransferase